MFFISKKDLPDKLKKGGQDTWQILNVVDRLTSYVKLYYCQTKEAAVVGRQIEKAVEDFEKILGIDRKDMIIYHDDGGEFVDRAFKPSGVKHEVIAVGPKVEQKNSHVQRVFHRLKNAERLSSVTNGLKQTEKIVNGSYNRVLKMSAEEAVEKYNNPEEMAKIITKYNAQREKWDTDRRKQLEVGDYVRIVVKSTKESGTFYKAYRGQTYTREGFPVDEANKHLHKPKQATKEAYKVEGKRGKNPIRYLVDGKWRTRDRLSEPLPYKLNKDGKKVLDYPDKKSEALLKERRKGAPKKKKKKETFEQDEENKDEEKQAEVQPSPKKKKKAAPALKPLKFSGKRGKRPSDVLEGEVEEKMAEWDKDEPPHRGVGDFPRVKDDTMQFIQAVKDGGDSEDLKEFGRYLLEYWLWMVIRGGNKMLRRDYRDLLNDTRKYVRKLVN